MLCPNCSENSYYYKCPLNSKSTVGCKVKICYLFSQSISIKKCTNCNVVPCGVNESEAIKDNGKTAAHHKNVC